ncbi:MAG: hypothetical protein CPSOU_3843 [uncultured Paraburkholderia sp.]|nr:MAG: hypothetical protein CPSOU_3843 [uncultured Paraburkholderia sp.]
MATRIRLSIMAEGLACAGCLAGMNTAQASDRLLKLLQLQTLRRMAPDAAPAKKNSASDDTKRQDQGTDNRPLPTQPYTRGAPDNSAPARKP